MVNQIGAAGPPVPTAPTARGNHATPRFPLASRRHANPFMAGRPGVPFRRAGGFAEQNISLSICSFLPNGTKTGLMTDVPAGASTVRMDGTSPTVLSVALRKQRLIMIRI
ncbi:Hypothetical protein GbCGDNIH8_8735 [Granulibacter bethesdensis]|nr:Hypothetical protein GbCGDNIH8_8735 [Granulibacter bethesdensis]